MLQTRGLPFEVPRYSLTGDVFSFTRCGLQYRYYNGSSLPPSRPVQLWTGEFIHGIMEEAYFYWKEYKQPFPWPFNQTPWPVNSTRQEIQKREPYDIGVLGEMVEKRLRTLGKEPRSRTARNAAYKRIKATLCLIAPYLFPLIVETEKKISGTRSMPEINLSPYQGIQKTRGDRYELTGIVDVITSVSLSQHSNNPIVKMIIDSIDDINNDFDIIVDYKAMRRPPIQSYNDDIWISHNWQIQTYAWLNRQLPKNRRIGAGILIYINELEPLENDLIQFKREINNNKTDVEPESGSQDYYKLNRWAPGDRLPEFSDNFLRKRALRIINVSDNDINDALTEIDNIIASIENCSLKENNTGTIPNNWPKNGKEQDCDACDFRHFCPSPANYRNSNNLSLRIPQAPG